VTRSVSALLTLFVAPTPEWVHWEYPVPRRIGQTRRRSSKEAVLFPADYSLMIKPCCPISHFLLALRPVRDLLLCAKHLFAAAKWQLPAAERSRTRNGTSSGLYEQDFAAIPMTQKGVVPPGCPRLKCAGVPMAPSSKVYGRGAGATSRSPPSRRCHITVSVRPQAPAVTIKSPARLVGFRPNSAPS
jgi:hypothetical protein